MENGEIDRLEQLWSGDFGSENVERNLGAAEGTGNLWADVFERRPARRVLVVGRNVGVNLTHIAYRAESWGVDISPVAIRELVSRVPLAGAGVAPAHALTYLDAWFDLTFTPGVVIHKPPSSLPEVMTELFRCSSRSILAAKYASESGDEEEITYREQPCSLFSRAYGRLYQELFPHLRLLNSWYTDDTTWDRTTFWVFDKT